MVSERSLKVNLGLAFHSRKSCMSSLDSRTFYCLDFFIKSIITDLAVFYSFKYGLCPNVFYKRDMLKCYYFMRKVLISHYFSYVYAMNNFKGLVQDL